MSHTDRLPILTCANTRQTAAAPIDPNAFNALHTRMRQLTDETACLRARCMTAEEEVTRLQVESDTLLDTLAIAEEAQRLEEEARREAATIPWRVGAVL